ncbi:MAG TPA: CHAP domain-containing protein [Chthoniobacterales bacterium]
MTLNPRSILVDIAAAELGVRETSRNHGEGIAKYWLETSYGGDGYLNREPYCSAFACYLVAEAIRRGAALGVTAATRPEEAAVRNFVAWARKPASGCKVFAPRDGQFFPQAGDFVWFSFGGDHPDHIGLVEDFDGALVRTIEANTGPDGGRDGDGVYRKRRALALCRGFIRLAWKARSA